MNRGSETPTTAPHHAINGVVGCLRPCGCDPPFGSRLVGTCIAERLRLVSRYKLAERTRREMRTSQRQHGYQLRTRRENGGDWNGHHRLAPRPTLRDAMFMRFRSSCCTPVSNGGCVRQDASARSTTTPYPTSSRRRQTSRRRSAQRGQTCATRARYQSRRSRPCPRHRHPWGWR